MFNNFNQMGGSVSKPVDSEINDKYEKLLNSKIYYLNKSSSKYICVGISLSNFTTKISISGQNGFHINLTEEEWYGVEKNEGIIANYFYSAQADTQPLKIGNLTVCFEKLNQNPIIKFFKQESYVVLGKESVDKLMDIKEIVDYRIQMVKKQEFQTYFNMFQHQGNNPVRDIDLFETVYQQLNHHQNTNNENVCTMLEMILLYPGELENKLKRGSKRKYYEEISNY